MELNKQYTILTKICRESLKLSGIKSGGLTEPEIRKISNIVTRLNKGLTESRELAGGSYMNDSDYLSGYLLYYWIVSYRQIGYILDRIEFGRDSALDLGAGPGALSIAMLDRGVVNVTAADKSQKALDLLRSIAQSMNYSVKTSVFDGESPFHQPADEKYDLITCGHFINELWKGEPDAIKKKMDFIMKLSERLSKNGKIILMEPAVNSISKELLSVRDALVENGLHVINPCLFSGKCPAASLDNAFCHSDTDWTPPDDFLKIAKAAGIRKNILKMSYFVFSKELPAGQEDKYIVVSDPMLSKSGFIRYYICGRGERITLRAKKDERSHMWYKDFTELKRGDTISFENAVLRETGYLLDKTSTLTVIKKKFL